MKVTAKSLTKMAGELRELSYDPWCQSAANHLDAAAAHLGQAEANDERKRQAEADRVKAEKE